MLLKIHPKAIYIAVRGNKLLNNLIKININIGYWDWRSVKTCKFLKVKKKVNAANVEVAYPVSIYIFLDLHSCQISNC